MPAGYYPIIYVRGYAAIQSEIDQAVDDPFSGFNLGSTILRPDQRTARPTPYAFEGPFVQLRARHGYVDTIENGRHNVIPKGLRDPSRTIWIFRYYDRASSRFATQRDRLLMTEAAWSLYEFVGAVLRDTGAPRVHLVAHSMGGLICRCMIQKVYPEMAADPKMPRGRSREAGGEIARLFTYATPHGGIALRNRVADVAGSLMRLTFFGAEVFRKEVMIDYLRPQVSPRPALADFDPQVMDAFPLEDVFCLVGTNAADYPVAGGASRLLMGPDSDGLVQIQRAFVRNAGSARVHRSHSGPFGIVNSHESFRHLEDFLFGRSPISITLIPGGPRKRSHGDDPDSGPQGEDATVGDESRTLHVDVRLARRDSVELAHEASREHFCPLFLREYDGDFHDVTLVTCPVHSNEEHPVELRLQIGIHASSPDRESSLGSFASIPDWTDTLELKLVGEAALARWLGENEWTPFSKPLELRQSFRIFEPRPLLSLKFHDTLGEPASISTPVTTGPAEHAPLHAKDVVGSQYAYAEDELSEEPEQEGNSYMT